MFIYFILPSTYKFATRLQENAKNIILNIPIMKRQQLTNLNNKQQYSFPIHPTTAYDLHLSSKITSYVQSYHCSPWIQFQDDLQYEQSHQYLKRYYRFPEYSNKIKLLSDYYRYHFQVPRLFMDGIARILQDNVDDRRELQYAIVTKQMNKDDEDDFPTINTHRGIQNHEKLIKDIELSYDDFEQKPKKKQKDLGLHKKVEGGMQKSASNASLQKQMTRVDSIKFKGTFLVLKPRIQFAQPKANQQSNKMVEPKYKKPKHIKQKLKQKKTKKTSEVVSHKGGKKQIQLLEKDKQRSKYNSKGTSVNNSLASQKGLSRSKSRTHLNVGGLKGKNMNNQNNLDNKNCKTKQKPSTGSLQNTQAKSCNKNEVLGEKRGITNVMSRKTSRIDLKIEQKAPKQVHKNPQNENNKVMSRRQSAAQIQLSKKMFSRALQIKKRKQ